MARRLGGRYGYPEAPHHFDVTLRPERLEQPLRWRKPRTVFVCSMGDLFHEDVPDWFRLAIMARIEICPQHVFLILTKRPREMYDWYNRVTDRGWLPTQEPDGRLFDNLWLLVTAENQAAADERISLLLQTPAAVRGVSCEPLLGSLDLNLSSMSSDGYRMLSRWYGPDGFDKTGSQPEREQRKVDWLIVGGESGPGARPMHPDWARDLRDQAQAAGAPFFFKQWGAWLPIAQSSATQRVDFDDERGQFHQWPDGTTSVRVGKKAAGRLLDGREWNEFPRTKGDTHA